MKRFLLLALPVLLIFGVCAGTYAIDTHSIVVGDKILGVLESRQITKNADGVVESLSLSPNGKNIVYVTRPSADDQYWLYRLSLTDTSGGRPTVLFDSWQYLPRLSAIKEEKKNENRGMSFGR